MPDISICPGCHTAFNTANVKAGKRLRCKKCKTVFVLSDSEPSPQNAPQNQPNTLCGSDGRPE